MNIQNSLSSSYYQGNPLNTDGILLHGTYSLPYNTDIDTSLIWGDYYFVQGCYHAMAAPQQVTGLMLGGVSYNQVPLKWAAQTGAIRYNVKRSTVTGGPYTYIAPPPVLTTNSYTDSSVAASTTYYYVVSASSVSGEGPNSAEVAVTTPATPPDFSISASPSSFSVSQSGSAGSTVNIGAVGGFTGTVTLSASNTAGLSVSFNPTTINGSGSSAMTVTAAGVPAGTYALTVSGTGGSVVRSTSVSVTVTPGGSFTLSANPSSIIVSRSSRPTGSTTISTTAVNGFTGKVSLSISSVPHGVSAGITPTSISAGGVGAILAVTAGPHSTPGSYSITVTGTSSSVPKFVLKVPLQINK